MRVFRGARMAALRALAARSSLSVLAVSISISLVWLISGCRKPAPVQVATSTPQSSPNPAPAPMLKAEQQSCRDFVQHFYDWYWNQSADKADDPDRPGKIHWYVDALRQKPSQLTPELARLIEKDETAQKASGGIAKLDFDPFLNSQDPSGIYSADRVEVSGDGCRATLNQQHIVADLRRSGNAWQFANFHYSFYSDDGTRKEAPDNDLVDILSQ